MLLFQLDLPNPFPTLLFEPRERSLFIPDEPMLEARFDRTWRCVNGGSACRSSRPLTLCTLFALAAMVEAIPGQRSMGRGYSDMYSNGGRLFAGSSRCRHLNHARPGVFAASICSGHQAPGTAYTKEYKTVSNVSLLAGLLGVACTRWYHPSEGIQGQE
jgi:hypothetical protein